MSVEDSVSGRYTCQEIYRRSKPRERGWVGGCVGRHLEEREVYRNEEGVSERASPQSMDISTDVH